MAKHFHTILIPVDFSVNTDIAVSKALSIGHHSDCVIHLLHVQQISSTNLFRYVKQLLSGYSWNQVTAAIKDSEQKLEELKFAIETRRKDVKVYISVCYGESVEDAIAKKAVNFGADLIVLGKHSHHSNFPQLNTVTPSRIALASGIPVLTAKPGSKDNAIKKVVMPVGARFPASKLAVMEALQCEAPIQIMLVVFSNDETDQPYPKQALLNTFKTLKSQSANPVRYVVLHGTNKARALLDYSKNIEADMLIVHPVTETRIGGWINNHISDLLPAHSKTLVMAVK